MKMNKKQTKILISSRDQEDCRRAQAIYIQKERKNTTCRRIYVPEKPNVTEQANENYRVELLRQRAHLTKRINYFHPEI